MNALSSYLVGMLATVATVVALGQNAAPTPAPAPSPAPAPAAPPKPSEPAPAPAPEVRKAETANKPKVAAPATAPEKKAEENKPATAKPAPAPAPAAEVAKPQQPAPAPAPAPGLPAPPQPPGARKPEADNQAKTKDIAAQPKPVPANPEPPKKKTIEEVTKNCEDDKGLFRVYRDKDNGTVFLYIKKKQLDQEFIYFSHTVDGVVGAGRNRGQFGDETVFTMHRNYEKVEFVGRNTAYYFDPEHPLARAARANVSDAVLALEPIVAENDEGILINAGNLFLRETLRQVKPSSGNDGKSLLGKLSETKTKFTRTKSFSRNTLFVVEYVYENPSPPRRDDEKSAQDVTDPRYVSVKVQHTLIAMPENDYQPRFDDPRVGYFMTQLTDQTSTEATPWRDFIHRWHLVKKDPNAPVSEPMEPITWWIENTTPHEFRPIIMEAGLKWNQSFEKIGFKNAVVIKEQPDNAEWDADDIDYNVLRWTSSPKPPFGGYGPSFVNPRTGQILGSDIMLEFAFVKNRIFARRLWSEVGIVGTDAAQGGGEDEHACMAGNLTQQGLMFGTNMMRLRKADQVDFDAMIKESLTQLILHELGHTLGLNHNFRASQMLSPADLQKRELTQKTALSGSVMDYMPMNLGPDKAHQGQYYITDPGPYDHWAIEYGYSVAAPDAEGEKQRLAAIAGRSHEPQLAFANDADDMRGAGKAIDPRAMIYDMSSDQITYGTQRCELVRQATGKLLEEYPKDGTSWQELTNAYVSLTSDAGNALAAISRYVGGVYVERPFVGQVKQGAPQPLRPVEAEKQRAAMQTLAKYAFAPDAWTAPEVLISHMQQQRRGFDFRSEGEDPKLHERALKIQRGLLDHLMHVNTQNRILDSSLYGNKYPLHEVMWDLTKAIIHGEGERGEISTQRQNLQIDYVDRLLGIVQGRGHLPAVQSVALAQLRQIQTYFTALQVKAPAANIAHIEFVKYKIARGLDEQGR
ncbi:uncharacterized protein DUF5117 [Roseimicrobium gellanilyticum]|uniref:Uncharacterized protein DUF5117 n=1 Tax=Roseimicrobium gellanilyticum TaxID=748857 RepID=A0A366HPG9_9BACT|nr:zinc-dependent metalloprotease [Roseimicrobium gellanilyticum]RBP45261.1 uncharacterized protein DUF5117 [Roseimicrobium gellanilyticum]